MRFYRHGHKLRAVNVGLTMSPTGKSGMALVAFRPRSAGRDRGAGDAPGDADRAAAHGHAGEGRRRCAAARARARAARRCACSSSAWRPRATSSASAASSTQRTARAVLAFRKVTGMARTRSPTPACSRRCWPARARFRVRHPDHGKHVEADLSRQVVALIQRARSSASTRSARASRRRRPIRGSFRVYSKTPGTNAKGMDYSNYFIRGYAIHGYASVPVFAASHGCLRVPIPDAISVFSWIKIGDIVDVYP